MLSEQTIQGLPPRLAGAVARAAAGREAWLVGGYVRDRLLGRQVGDADIAVAGDPRAVARTIASELGGHAFPLSVEHGAWRVTLAGRDRDCQLDITRLRGSLGGDLGLRDFTINAIALPVAGGAPIDPLGGIGDLRRRVIRAASPSAIRDDPVRALRAVRHAAELEMSIEAETAALIRRDGEMLVGVSGERQRDELLRILATDAGAASFRLLDTLGLIAVTLPEMEAARGCVQPPEHFWDVFEHSIETVAVLDCLMARGSEPARMMHDAASQIAGRDQSPPYTRASGRGAINRARPSKVGEGRGASSHPSLSCESRRREPGVWWGDSAQGYWDEALTPPRSRRSVLKLVGLLHDVSKPGCRRVDEDGRIRFFGHDERGGELVEAVFERLRLSSAETRYAALLVREHLRPGQLAARGEIPSARALFRLFRDLGDAVPDLLLLNLADGAAAAGPRQTAEQWAGHVRYASWILEQRDAQRERAGPRRLVTGYDLMGELLIAPGPAIGRLLDALAEAQAAGEVSSREEALALAKSLHDGDPEGRSGLG